jgi:hypothetical protein
MSSPSETRQVRVHLPLDLHRAVRHAAVDAGVPIADVIVRLLRDAVERRT